MLSRSLEQKQPQPADQETKNRKLSTEVLLVEDVDHSGATGTHHHHYGASSVPIYQSATFKQPLDGDAVYDYSRSGNPTRTTLQVHMAKLMKAQYAFAVASGMAALDVILRGVMQSMTQIDYFDIVTGDDLYGGSNRMLAHYEKLFSNVQVHHVDTSDLDVVQQVLQSGRVKVLLLESPTNPMMKIASIPKICQFVKQMSPSTVVVVDNTMMSPYLQRPLTLGADISYHSGTKFLCGHHDVTAGVVGTNNDVLAKSMAHIVNTSGCGLAPFDSFLLLRGIKTLAIRVDRAQSNAAIIAKMLFCRWGFCVRYPGIRCSVQQIQGKTTKATEDEWEDHFAQARGAGCVLSFTLNRLADEFDHEQVPLLVTKAQQIIQRVEIFQNTVSFGTVNSLISLPAFMSHASIPAEVRKARGLREDLIRLCVGIEDINDLWDDLESALLEAGLEPISSYNILPKRVEESW